MDKSMRVIIAGSRSWTDWDIMKSSLDRMKEKITEVVSGTARGADEMGEWWAQENNIPIKRFPADWSRYGKAAGFIRNEEMAKYADALVAFRVGHTKGTSNMIKLAYKYGLRVEVFDDGSTY